VLMDDPHHPREFSYWQGIGIFVLLLVTVLVVGGISSAVFGFHVTAILGELLIFLIPLSFLSAGGYSLHRFLAYPGKLNFKFWLGTIAASLALYLVISDVSGYVHRLFPRPAEQKEALLEFFVAKTWMEYFFRIFAACLLAGFCEEFAFRGFFQSVFSKRLGATKGLVFTSFLFAFMHLDPWNFAGVFLLALFLGYLVLLTNNLWAAVAVHFLFNSIGFSLGFFSPQVGSDFEFTYPPYITLICTAIFIFSLNFFRNAYKESNPGTANIQKPPIKGCGG
jgi:membrane protease YdiL (CAAX protease family)